MSINGLNRNNTAFTRITGRTNQPSSISSQNADLSYPVPGSRTAKLYSASEPNAITVSAGAIESPKLLLNSGVGDPEKFIKHGINPVIDLPGVGKNLRDHPMVYVAWEPTEGYINPKTNYSRVGMGLRYTSNDSNFINDMIVYMNSSTRNNGNPEVPEGIKANLTLNLEESSGEVFLNDDNPDDYPKLSYRLFFPSLRCHQ